MTQAASVPLDPGRVYRTANFRPWGDNPTRLARRLEARGEVVCLGHGLWLAPRRTRFGTAPASDEALLNAFLGGSPWVFTGPSVWNALGLGSTALFVHPRVYNTKRSGRFTLGGRTFDLRRTAFPSSPSAEWYVVDLLRHADDVGMDRDDLIRALSRQRRKFDAEALRAMAERFGTRREREAVERALAGEG